MAGKHLSDRNIAVVEGTSVCADNSEVDVISSLDNTAVNQGAETERTVMSEFEYNNAGNIMKTEIGVGMSSKQLQDILTNALSTLRTDIIAILETNNSKVQAECSKLRSAILTITERLDSELQVVTENITVKIRVENEKLTQKLQNEVKKLSTDICTLRNDTERKIKKSLHL